GLSIAAGNSTVRGLAINRFNGNGASDGIVLQTNGGNKIEGCFIGLDATGMTDLSNSRYGVDIESGANTIGSLAPQGRNVIVGVSSAIFVAPDNLGGNKIQGNYIGTNA